MEEEVSGRNGPTRPGDKRPALSVNAMNFGMRKLPPFDRHMLAYVDRLTFRRHYRFYERTEPARTKPTADVPALEGHREGRRERRADEDEIADRSWTPERLDAP
jgi:hypothetical protein